MRKSNNTQRSDPSFGSVVIGIPKQLRSPVDQFNMGLGSTVELHTKASGAAADKQLDPVYLSTVCFTRKLLTDKYPQKEKALRRHVELGGDAKDKVFKTARYWCFYKRL